MVLTSSDISYAFLNGGLDEEIYMKFPPGYAELQGEDVSPNVVCHLHKSIYGLKHASNIMVHQVFYNIDGFWF